MRLVYHGVVHILVDVASDRLRGEILELLARAGHTVERATARPGKPFDVALVGSAEVAERLRRDHPHGAIVVVTKLGDVPARVRALEVGADDAIDASFPPSQIAARVGAAGRRAAAVPRHPERVAIDGCTIDLSAATASRDGRTIALTPLELSLVRWLARHAGQVVARTELLQHVWRVSPRSATRAVDVAIAALRAKLERDPANPAIIVSVRGAGYRWG
jgi:DNA-binding response OmpR family regulator